MSDVPRYVTFGTLRPSADHPMTERFSSGIRELDRVLGGGWVRGAVYLLSGDPGAGKSTLLLKAAAFAADPDHSASSQRGRPVAYVAAEEAATQVQARAARLNVDHFPVQLTDTDDINAAFRSLVGNRPSLVVVDSAQRMFDPAMPNREPGSTAQVRAVGRAAVRFARAEGATVVLVCHETKGGRAAGPNALFHDVDAVLHLAVADEYRLLTARKNRYGATDVVGLFRMTPAGLVGITDRDPR